VADFTQVYRSVGLGQEVTERGRIFVRRPGLMRWDYREPDRKAFLVEAVPDAEGLVETLSYLPADLTAVRGRLAVAEAPHLQLLLGQGSLDDVFAVGDVRLKEPRDAGARHLRLVPRRPLQSVEVAYLEVDEKSLAVSRLLLVDALGNESDLVLERVREGVRIKDSVFDTRLPPGVTVRDARPER
jgi:outer membrane lipoprotein carrier protein